MSTRGVLAPLHLTSTFSNPLDQYGRTVIERADVMVTPIVADPLTPPESVTDALMTCDPAVRARVIDAPVPSAPSMLDVQPRRPVRLPSSGSVAVPAKL